MVQGLKRYLEVQDSRLRRLEQENEVLKDNNRYLISLLSDILRCYSNTRKYRIQDLIDAIGNYVKKETTDPDPSHSSRS